MKIGIARGDLDRAARRGLITEAQAEGLWRALSRRADTIDETQAPAPDDIGSAKLDLPHVAWFAGALLVAAAMLLFMRLLADQFGGESLVVTATVYAVLFALAGYYFWFGPGPRTVGGLMFVLAVCMAPPALYGLMLLSKIPVFFDEGTSTSDLGRFVMEAGTVAAGGLALAFIRFPFLTAPVAAALWFMSFELGPLLLGGESCRANDCFYISMGFGLIVMGISFAIDRRTREDYAFWGYVFGLLAFWGAYTVVTQIEGENEAFKAIYGLVNLALIVVSVLLQRGVFTLFGALGLFLYFLHLAWGLFEDSLLFPLALIGLGLAIVWAGVMYHRRREAIEAAVDAQLPDALRRILPRERG